MQDTSALLGHTRSLVPTCLHAACTLARSCFAPAACSSFTPTSSPSQVCLRVSVQSLIQLSSKANRGCPALECARSHQQGHDHSPKNMSYPPFNIHIMRQEISHAHLPAGGLHLCPFLLCSCCMQLLRRPHHVTQQQHLALSIALWHTQAHTLHHTQAHTLYPVAHTCKHIIPSQRRLRTLCTRDFLEVSVAMR
mgnify:CR=1 FL=1